MFDIGAWRRPWIAAGITGWALAMAVHVAAFAGVDFPTAVGWVLFLGVFVPFMVAVFTHPRARVRGAHARIGWRSAFVGAWPPWIALGLGSFVYVLVISHVLGVHRVEMDHHLSRPEMEGVSAVVAAFFAMSATIQSSARSVEQRGIDPGP